jgi:hypothetical protein
MCAETKLIPSWRLGARDAANADAFMRDVSERLGSRVQLTTDVRVGSAKPHVVRKHVGGRPEQVRPIKPVADATEFNT